MTTALSISLSADGDRVVLVVTGELDLATLPRLASSLDECVTATGATVEVDLSGVSFLDCAGVRTLLDYRKRAATSGSTLRVVRPSAAVLRVLTGHVRDVLVGPPATRTTTKVLQCLICEAATPHVRGPNTVGSDGSVLVRWWSCTQCDEGHTLP